MLERTTILRSLVMALWSLTASLILVAVSSLAQAQEYIPLESLRISDGRVQFLFFSAGGCINLSNDIVDGVVYSAHTSKWQRKDGATWVDVPGTERAGICSYSPTDPGEYRLVVEIAIDGTRGYYSSENTLGVEISLSPVMMPDSGTGKVGVESFFVPDLGAWSITSIGTETVIGSGYGRISVEEGSTTPSGIAFFEFRQDGVLVSEVGVAASEPVREGRIHAELAGAINTGLAIANPNSTAATIDFYLTGADGARLAEGSFELGANRQVANFLDEAPFNIGNAVSGTLTFTSTAPVAVIALRGLTNRDGEYLMTTLPVTPLASGAAISSDTVYMPLFVDGDGWATQVVLVNPMDEAITGTVEFLGPGSDATAAAPAVLTLADGRRGSEFPYSIPASGSQTFTTSNPAGALGIGSIRATPASGSVSPSGFAIASITAGGKTFSEFGINAPAAGRAFRLYAESSETPGQAGSVRTVLVAADTANTASSVSLELTGPDGAQAVPPLTLQVPPSGLLAGFVDEWFHSLPTEFSGVLRVTSTADVSVAGLRLRTNERGEPKLTAVPPSDETGAPTMEDRFFPHIVDSAGWSTKINLFSGIAEQASTGTLSFVDSEGEPWDLPIENNNPEVVPPGSARYEVGGVIATLPTGFWDPDVTSGASFSYSGVRAVIVFDNGGYIEEGGFTYTCETAGGCEVSDRRVVSGTIVQAKTMPEGSRSDVNDIDGDGIPDHGDAFPKDPARHVPENGISITLNDQIVMELLAEDTEPASLFDLNGGSLLFRPVGGSGYVRSVEPLSWETDIGSEVDDRGISFDSFAFPFAESEWRTFHVNINGNITFGQSLGKPLSSERSAELRLQGSTFTKGISMIAALYKPYVVGRTYVSQFADRAVITWSVSEYDSSGGSYIDAFSPSPATGELQAVLFADGSISLNYKDVGFGDGIVGLFPVTTPMPSERLATLSDTEDIDLPGYLDLTEVAVFDTESDSLIIEFATRGDIPDFGTPEVENINYSFYLDVDDPLVSRIDFQDADFGWRIEGRAGGRYTAYQIIGIEAPSVRVFKDAPDRIRLLIQSPGAKLTAGTVAGFADAFEAVNGETGRFDQANPVNFELFELLSSETDLSTDGVQQASAYEAFHFRGLPNQNDLTCRLIQTLGDGFDFLVIASEFRMDQQRVGNSMQRYGAIPEGIGISEQPNHPCSEGRLKGQINDPFYMGSEMGHGAGPPGFSSSSFNFALSYIGHEFGHLWTANAAYEDGGRLVQLFDDDSCNCHWRWELHAPAMFPWDEDRQASAMGGGYWEENADGTFTRVADDYFIPASGFSPLDLYLMGFLDASEVPDTFLLRDPVLLRYENGFGVYSGTREEISVNQVIAALGPREPAADRSQKEFNIALVYQVEPGSSPSIAPLQRHAAMRDKVVEYWSHVTGGRSRITSDTRFDGDVP